MIRIYILFFLILKSSILLSQDRLTAEAEPVSTVARCVNVISGDFFQADTDLIVEGHEPLYVSRFYDSGHEYESKLGYGSGLHFPLGVRNLEHSGSYCLAMIDQREGAGISYKGIEKHGIAELQLRSEIKEKGLSNYTREGISGQTNIQNIKPIYKQNESILEVVLGDKTKRKYERHLFTNSKKKEEKIYRLVQEDLPNNNKRHFQYNKGLELTKITAADSSNVGEFSKLIFDYDGDKHWAVYGSNGQYVDYRLKKYYVFVTTPSDDENETKTEKVTRYLLDEVTRSQGPKIKYKCLNLNPNNPKSLRIDKVEYPEERFLKISYTKDGQVAYLKGPVGYDNKPVVTHSFHYHKNYTSVYDALKNKTKYKFHPEKKRILEIEHFDGEQLRYSDRFIWEDKVHLKKGWLKAKVLSLGNGTAAHMVSYNYDERGNVTQETFHGNLTGNAKRLIHGELTNTFIINDDDKISPEAESYSIARSYSTDGFNLLLTEATPEGQTILRSYIPDSNLLNAEYVKSYNQIQKRTFHGYDVNGTLILTILDNGSTEDKDNLQDATVRRYIHYFPIYDTQSVAYGKSSQIIEEAYDIAASKTLRLSRRTFSYDSSGRVIREDIFDAENQWRYSLDTTYDKAGRVIEQTDPLGNKTTFAYDVNNNKIKEEDLHTCRKIVYTYDFANRLISTQITHPNEPTFVTTNKYNILNQKIATIDTFGNVTTYQYDPFGHEIAKLLPLIMTSEGNQNPTYYKTYDPIGNIATETDGNGHKKKYLYNSYGKVTKIYQADGSIEQREYYLNGWLRSKTNSVGTKTIFTYDPLGQIITEETFDNEAKKTTSYKYKGNLLIAKTDPLGNVIEFRYDAIGRKSAEIQHGPEGDITTLYHYDSMGRIQQIHHPISEGNIKVEAFEYDLLNRVLEERIEDQDGNVLRMTKYTYDAFGNKNRIYRYSEKESYSIEETCYHSNSMPKWHRDALGKETHYTYDFGHLNEIGQKVLKKTTTHPNGAYTITVFDALGRIYQIEERNSFGVIQSNIKTLYDLAGNKIQEKSWCGKGEEFLWNYVIKWEYDFCNRVIKLLEQDRLKAAFTYNSEGQPQTWTKPDNVVVYSSHDGFGRLTHQYSSDGSIDYTYQYDINDRLIKVHDSIRKTNTLRSYDMFGRIIEETLGNNIQVYYTYDTLNRPLSYKVDGKEVTYSWNAHDLISASITHSKNHPTLVHEYLKTDLQGRLLQSLLPGNIG